MRIALHSGLAETSGTEYFAPHTLNRLSRIMAVAHGGQTLLSATTYELVADHLPAAVTLRDLGERRLRDLLRPERLYQLDAPDLPTDFPPLHTPDRHANLPALLTATVGREREVAAIAALLRRADVRLLTLTGPGGTGKTRLGLQVAANLLDYFASVYFIPLATISDHHLVASTIATALEVKEDADTSLLESIKQHLHDQHTLLVLDNFEQVLDAAPLVAELLAAAPQVKALITSREELHLYGEYEFPVPPLALPDLKRLPPAAQLSQYAAVALFIQRAQLVKPDFAVTNANAAAVAEICARLDGLPLAIELAAARIKLLPPQAMLAKLGRRLSLLTGGARDQPQRQQTLRGAIDWSYNLLTEDERRLFSRLSVFVGGCTIEAAEAVGGEVGLPILDFGSSERNGGQVITQPPKSAIQNLKLNILDQLTQLCDKSLMRQEEFDGEPRFMMLETIREYALDKLAERGEAEATCQRQAEYYLQLADQASAKMSGAEQASWLLRLERELDNVRAVLGWALEGSDAETALRLCGTLWQFWLIRGYLTEGRSWIMQALGKAAVISPKWRSSALNTAGILAAHQGDRMQARSLFEQCLMLRRDLEDSLGIANTINSLGALAYFDKDYAAALPLYSESLAIMRELNDKAGTSRVLNNLGLLHENQGDYQAARALLNEALDIDRELGDEEGIATELQNLGNISYNEGNYVAAEKDYRQSLQFYASLGDKQSCSNLLDKYAALKLWQEQPEDAVRLLSVAEAIRQAIHITITAEEQDEHEKAVAEAHAKLNSAAFDAGWAEGQAMSLGQAVAYTLERP